MSSLIGVEYITINNTIPTITDFRNGPIDCKEGKNHIKFITNIDDERVKFLEKYGCKLFKQSVSVKCTSSSGKKIILQFDIQVPAVEICGNSLNIKPKIYTKIEDIGIKLITVELEWMAF